MTIQELTNEYIKVSEKLSKVKSASQINHYLKIQLQITNEIREIQKSK